ncbi:hypothetical protein BDQ17DRAFT_1352779 [Cyathus striatus]|nr:hypothetical protein BDQ17DRAFT_1352779 [Cyathus striatus]
MAFPIPDHLPRRSKPQDVSSGILTKIDNATYQTLNVQLASTWVNELNESISSTKAQIHERIQANLPEFQHQSQACKSAQSRLETLTSSVDKLRSDVLDPETGLVPTVTSALGYHNALAQEASNAQAKFEALSHLLKCRREFDVLQRLVQAGKLPQAIEATPTPLQKFRALKAFAEEQLNEAWSRGVVVEPSRIAISAAVQVRESDTVLSLTDIVHSLHSTSLSDQLMTLRRNLMIHFIDMILTQPAFISVTFTMTEHSLVIIPSPPNGEVRTQRQSRVAIPSIQRLGFLRALSKPVTTSILNSILIPSLPSSLDKLPEFLQLLQHALAFEDKYLVGLLGGEAHDRPIDLWGKGVCGHYERQRRNQILDQARMVILAEEDFLVRFPIEVEILAQRCQPEVKNESGDFADDASWGFEEDNSETGDSIKVEDSWGLDTNLEVEPEAKADLVSVNPHAESIQQLVPGEELNSETAEIDAEPDPADAWGWDDNEEDIPPEDQMSEETAWDDPWAEPSDSSSSKLTSGSPEAKQQTLGSSKKATRLEKLASKNKSHINGTASSPPQLQPQNTPTPSFASEPIKKASVPKLPSKLTTTSKEIYMVSGNTKEIVKVVKDVITEGREFQSSKIFATTNAGSTPGAILLQTAPSVLDLYRALFPVRFSPKLQSAEGGFLFSNNCLYLSAELDKIEFNAALNDFSRIKENLSECRRYLKVLANSWFHDTVEREQRTVEKILADGTQGFTYTGDQDRYDECESAIGQVLRHIRQLAQKLKGILTKGKYYTVIGQVADAALSRILTDIIALPDIPELESHRLSELSKILNALEGLFSEDPNESSFVVAYVPSWLKYSYLSELLEASMADITYLFEEGALVDFDLDELVKLVRALFADTPLRTHTINKILEGHPQH